MILKELTYFFLDIIMLMLLAKCEFGEWIHIFKNLEL